MNSRNRRVALSAASILAITGLAATTLGQVEQDQRRQPYGETGAGQPTAVTVWEFRKGSALIGMEVEDGTGEAIASVSDLIFERGSGQITHAVLSAGGVLGIGSKEFAVPYSRLHYVDGAGDGALGGDDSRFTTDIDRGEIERTPEFVATEWSNLNHTTWWEETKSWFGAGEDADDEAWDDEDADHDHDMDRYGETIRESERQELRGTVQSVDRDAGEDGETILTIETAEGETKTVLLGPSWYVMSQEGTPYRSDEISLEVCPLESGEADFVACKSLDESKPFSLRDDEGNPAWSSQNQGAAASPRLMLVSDLVGANATLPSRDETGEVEDVIIETNSGRIVLAALDANENFLGVGDDLKAVPWPVVRVVNDDTVRIDATEDMLVNSEELPDEVTVLATPARLEPVYMVYEVEIAPMERRSAAAEMPQDWQQDQAMGDPIEALRGGEEITISGRVTDVSPQTVSGFDGQMMVATIETDDGPRTVVLGSQTYFDENPLMLGVGDEVHVEARTADVDGHELIAATTLEANGQETALWSGDSPIWDD